MGVNGKISIDICALFNVAFDDPIIDCCQVTLIKIDSYGLYENDLMEKVPLCYERSTFL